MTTRLAVLDATIEAIVRYGYEGATSNRIAAISGLTRGAQIHHFPSKAAMVVEALLHLSEIRTESMEALIEELKTIDDIEQFVMRLWGSFDSDLWIAAAELWTAARTNSELRDALVVAERTIDGRIRDALLSHFDGVFFGVEMPVRRMTAIFGMAFAAIRGIAMRQMFDPNERRVSRQLEEHVRAIRSLTVTEAAATGELRS